MKKLTDLFCHVDDFCKAFFLSGKNFRLKEVNGSAITKVVCSKEK